MRGDGSSISVCESGQFQAQQSMIDLPNIFDKEYVFKITFPYPCYAIDSLPTVRVFTNIRPITVMTSSLRLPHRGAKA